MTDTIYALSTPPGRAAVAVVRLSGPGAGLALEQLCGTLPSARVASLRQLRDPKTGEALDDALALWLPGPKSFTGEDMAELQLHGSPAVVQGLLTALGGIAGLRPAEAGEFTRRAFDKGRLDLAEVEGLADLIASETSAQRRQALAQMEGGLSRRIAGWAEALTRLLAYLEANIDFPDEDLPEGVGQETLAGIAALKAEIAGELSAPPVGERLREGLTIALIGPPNAGKSSLLNRLADREVAIVTDSPGTTRDVVEVRLDLAGYPVTLCDTAGLRDAALGLDPVEAEGIRRSLARAEAADLKLLVSDARDWPALDPMVAAQRDARALLLLNKADLVEALEPGEALAVSAKTGAGLDALVARLKQEIETRIGAAGREAPVITRARHRAALEGAVAALERAGVARELEIAAEELRLALCALGRITGKVDVEDLLDVVFKDFCIGK